MPRRRRLSRTLLTLFAVLAALGGAATLDAGTAGAAGDPRAGSAPPAGSPTVATSDRLDQRRFVVAGTRAYEVGTEDARHPVVGFHTRGEIGGFVG